MDPQEFIGLASHIVGIIDQIPSHLSEAAARTSISRIYYGTLHWLQKRLAITVPRSKVKAYHAHVIDQLEKILDDEILIDFNFLMRSRVDADYFLDLTIGLPIFKECIESSERIIQFLIEPSSIEHTIEDERRYFLESRNNREDKHPQRTKKRK
jgi:hypothetical protein